MARSDHEAKCRIDGGEAILYALAAEHDGLVILSGDKRAIGDIHRIPGLAEALTGRVVTVEACMLVLCDVLGPEELLRRLRPHREVDSVFKACFSSGAEQVRDNLTRYQTDLEAAIGLPVLWRR